MALPHREQTRASRKTGEISVVAKEMPVARVIRLPGREPPDRDIVEGLLARDPGAATEMYDRYAERVNRLVWRMLGADQEHDDVVQQVFAHALADIRKLRDPEALGSWLVGIAVHTVRRELRTRRARRVFRLVPGTVELPPPDPGPGRRPLAPRVFGILAGMRAGDRIAFALRFVEGYSLGECASACGCSLATVKRRLTRARRVFMRRARRDPVLASWMREAGHEEG
jgi:RNA polymerase sigma-70 factor (ECF subfamily)